MKSLVLGTAFSCLVSVANARDFGQWETVNPEIREWYQALMQPDNPSVSCCGEADAYWADSFEVDGDKYVAIITDSRPDEPLRRKHIDVGTRIVVPNHKLKYDQSNPTGHGIIFLRRCADCCSCPARRSVRSRQPSHRKLNLPVGKLPPVLDDWQVTALRRLIDDFAGLQTGRINRQRENLSLRNARHPVCQIPGTNEHVTPPWLMLASVPS